MNLTELFELQKPLRERIIKNHSLEGQDLFPNMNLALLVELGELANNWRGFKHWSVDQEPRTSKKAQRWEDGVCLTYEVNPLLEEYADCLSFILELGIETGFEVAADYQQYHKPNITGQFLFLFDVVSFFYYHRTQNSYDRIVRVFLGLGAMLGFTWEQIVQAYLDKNRVNFERQDNGY